MRKYISLFILVLVVAVAPCKAQGNLPYADDRFIHFGFSLGINTMDFGVKLSNQDIDGKVYRAEVSGLSPGFSAGLISDLRLNRYFNFRFTPTIHFSDRTITYQAIGESEKHTESIFSIPFSLPVHIKYSAERLHNFRPYILAGGGVYFDFGRDAERNIQLRPFDVFIEFGLGCDIYFAFFKLAPEIRFAIGFNNMLTPVDERIHGNFDKKYTYALSGLTTKMITIAFNIE